MFMCTKLFTTKHVQLIHILRSIFPCACLSVYIPVCVSVCFYIHLLNHCLSVYLTVHLSFCLMTLDVYQSVPTKPVQLFPILRCLSICLSVYLSHWWSIYTFSLSVHLFTKVNPEINLTSQRPFLPADMRLSWKKKHSSLFRASFNEIRMIEMKLNVCQQKNLLLPIS